jgi:hypothetical protein
MPHIEYRPSALVKSVKNGGSTNYDVTRDGRFVAATSAGTDTNDVTVSERSSQEIQIVLNWFEELKRLALPK